MRDGVWGMEWSTGEVLLLACAGDCEHKHRLDCLCLLKLCCCLSPSPRQTGGDPLEERC